MNNDSEAIKLEQLSNEDTQKKKKKVYSNGRLHDRTKIYKTNGNGFSLGYSKLNPGRNKI